MTLRIKDPKTTYQFKKGSPNSNAKIAAAAKKAKRAKIDLQTEILRVWAMGQYNSADIAERLKIPEADVCRALAARKLRKAVITPQAGFMPPAPRRLYRLRSGENYLNAARDGVTKNLTDAWTGNAEEAVACASETPIAKMMMMELA